jgi:hypothetical protein
MPPFNLVKKYNQGGTEQIGYKEGNITESPAKAVSCPQRSKVKGNANKESDKHACCHSALSTLFMFNVKFTKTHP